MKQAPARRKTPTSLGRARRWSLTVVRVAQVVAVDDKVSEPLVAFWVDGVLDNRKAIEPRQNRIGERNVLVEGSRGVVSAAFWVRRSNDTAAGLKGGDDPCLGDRDGLLLHGLVDGDAVLVVHLIKLVDEANPAVRKNQSPSLHGAKPYQKTGKTGAADPYPRKVLGHTDVSEIDIDIMPTSMSALSSFPLSPISATQTRPTIFWGRNVTSRVHSLVMGSRWTEAVRPTALAPAGPAATSHGTATAEHPKAPKPLPCSARKGGEPQGLSAHAFAGGEDGALGSLLHILEELALCCPRVSEKQDIDVTAEAVSALDDLAKRTEASDEAHQQPPGEDRGPESEESVDCHR